ncbi:hypothetical protein F5B19DRAFT_477315 [Rostrohypoxylon terebratum]|nr:hypothetical protein F5B19DRAFT_477315 [Rostrohypoxylon terebratum]
MDWPKENDGISETDLLNCFKYEPKRTRVLRLEGVNKEPFVKLLETDEQWIEWVDKELPKPNSGTSGLVMILARRAGQQRRSTMHDELNGLERESLKSGRVQTFPPQVGGDLNAEKGLQPSSCGRRGARTLPFSQGTFRLISQKLYLHGSIARVVNRSDIPIFSRAEINMSSEEGSTYATYIYNCRSTNAWNNDLALTVTHFPNTGLSYAVLFGCPVAIEEEIIRRLSSAGEAASYPLLVPGIFAELERIRHIEILETYVDDIEQKILELDYPHSIEQIDSTEIEKRNRDKRSQWLDMTYLRNSLLTWREQLVKMTRHTEELKETLFETNRDKDIHVEDDNIPPVQLELGLSDKSEFYDIKKDDVRQDEIHRSCAIKVGAKFHDRLQTIIDEYDDKIRECTMRIDGMAMATQWSHGETNVEIALATGRDSKHMRTISIVSMVFLPGTFMASIFSMQFFNWLPSQDTVVSQYFWIYILATVIATMSTLGIYYYCVVWRHRSRKMPTEEDGLWGR